MTAMVALIAKMCACVVLIVPAGAGNPAGTTEWSIPVPVIRLDPSVLPVRTGSLRGGGSFEWSMYGLFVIAHELGHANWRTGDEAAANCWAALNWRRVAVALGATAGEAAYYRRFVPAAWRGCAP